MQPRPAFQIYIYERESRDHNKDDDCDDKGDDCDDNYRRSIVCNPLHYQYCLMRDGDDQDDDCDEKDHDCEDNYHRSILCI